MAVKIDTRYRLIGLESIEMGPVGGTGVLGETLVTIKNIVEGSAAIVFELPGKVEERNEDSDYADIIINQPAAKFIQFSVRDMDPRVWELAFGGTTDETGWAGFYDTPLVVQEKSIIAVSKDYGGEKMRFYITRAMVRAGAQLNLTKTASGFIPFTCDIARPETPTFPIAMEII